MEGDCVYGVKNAAGEYEYEVRYDAGPKDRAYMAEGDRLYLAELLRTDKLREKEPAVWYLWQTEGAAPDIGEWWVQKLAACDSAHQDLSAILTQAEQDEKRDGDRIAQKAATSPLPPALAAAAAAPQGGGQWLKQAAQKTKEQAIAEQKAHAAAELKAKQKAELKAQQEAKKQAKAAMELAKAAAAAAKPPSPPTPPPQASSPAPVIKFSDLQFKKELGKGGFGVVSEGVWQYTAVAIKQLLLTTMTAETLAEFAKETEIMSRLRHPHITSLYGTCQETGHYCMVMEYMSKGSLYNLLHNGQNLEWPSRWEIAQDISKGLAYLHGQNMVHRDLKSPNILLDITYRAKLADFGLAKVKLETDSTTKTVCGTTRWMAPEQLKGEGSSKQSDVYSYGMVLWEIATRKIPYESSPNAVVNMLIFSGTKETIPPPPACPKAFGELIGECWLERTVPPAASARPTAEQALIKLQQAAPTPAPQP